MTEIEKAARAIAAENYEEYERLPRLYTEVARACIASLIPPSEGMVRAMEAGLRAADESWATGDKLMGWDQVEVAFTAAISHILKEKTE